jgi:hypothetical protein
MIRFAIIALAVALSLGAVRPAAALEMLGWTEEAIEAHLNLAEMPANDTDAVRINGCPGCATITKRVTPATRYFLGRTEVPFADFRAAVAEVRASHTGAENTLIGVFFSLESDLVTRIIMRAPRN